MLNGGERQVAADAVGLATADLAETMLAGDLAGSNLELHTIGDALAPRRAHSAIFEGRKLGLSLSESQVASAAIPLIAVARWANLLVGGEDGWQAMEPGMASAWRAR